MDMLRSDVNAYGVMFATMIIGHKFLNPAVLPILQNVPLVNYDSDVLMGVAAGGYAILGMWLANKFPLNV